MKVLCVSSRGLCSQRVVCLRKVGLKYRPYVSTKHTFLQQGGAANTTRGSALPVKKDQCSILAVFYVIPWKTLPKAQQTHISSGSTNETVQSHTTSLNQNLALTSWNIYVWGSWKAALSFQQIQMIWKHYDDDDDHGDRDDNVEEKVDTLCCCAHKTQCINLENPICQSSK